MPVPTSILSSAAVLAHPNRLVFPINRGNNHVTSQREHFSLFAVGSKLFAPGDSGVRQRNGIFGSDNCNILVKHGVKRSSAKALGGTKITPAKKKKKKKEHMYKLVELPSL